MVCNVLWVVFVEAAGLDGAGDRQILARHDHRRCCHRSLSIRDFAEASGPPAMHKVQARPRISKDCSKIRGIGPLSLPRALNKARKC